MSSNLIKIVAGVFVVLAAILGFVAFKMGHNYAENSNSAVTQATQAVQTAVAPQAEVVVAVKPIPAKQPIDKDSVRVVKTLEVVPTDYYAKIEDVVGKTPLIDIDSGTPLTPALLKGNQVARQIPPGSKAVSLILSDVVGVGGFVRPGDIVDVLVYLRNDQQNKVDPSQARILQKDALVLAFDDHILNPPPPDKNGQQQPPPQRHERTVVVAVPDSEVTRVMLGASMGEVRLALHGQAQDQVVAQTQTNAAPATAAPGAAAPASSATAPVTAAAVTNTAALPTPVSGASLASSQTAAAPAAATPAGAEQQLPDQPYTSAELAKLKPKRASKGAPQGIVIYRGSKASTVYP